VFSNYTKKEISVTLSSQNFILSPYPRSTSSSPGSCSTFFAFSLAAPQYLPHHSLDPSPLHSMTSANSPLYWTLSRILVLVPKKRCPSPPNVCSIFPSTASFIHLHCSQSSCHTMEAFQGDHSMPCLSNSWSSSHPFTAHTSSPAHLQGSFKNT
jgi:hypothetical protein